jgi:hypothetical protein
MFCIFHLSSKSQIVFFITMIFPRTAEVDR